MDTKLLLVKAITLLYRESLISEGTSSSAELITTAIGLIKFPDNSVVSEFSKDPISGMRDLIKVMLDKPLGYTYDKTEFLQALRVICNNDNSLYQSLFDGVTTDYDKDKLLEFCKSYRNSIHTFVLRWTVKDLIKNANHSLAFDPNLDWRSFTRNLISKLEPFSTMEYGDDKHPSVVRDITFNNRDDVIGAFQRASTELSTEGVLRLHLHGLNRMTGFTNGFRRGEFITLAALQHNYKSGMALDIFAGIAKYNIPKLRDPSKKAMLMRLSFENPIETDILHLYKNIVGNKTGIAIDVRDIDIIEATDYVINELRVNGFEINIAQIDPSEYTFNDLFDRVNKFEAAGYEIVFLEADYLSMMSKQGCTQGATGQDIRDLFRRVRNFMAKKGITFLTPHQLSTDAKTLVRMGVDNFVKEIANKGYYDGCKTIDQEVDLEIYIHIVKVNGVSYLTIQRGKHRRPGDITPDKDQFTVYKFDGPANIQDDVCGKDCSRSVVGGDTLSDGGSAPWYAMAA